MGRLGKTYMLALAVTAGLTAVYGVHRDLAGQYRFYLRNEEYVRTMRTQLESLSSEEKRLQERVDGLQHDPIEIEADIRRTKSLVRPGERIYRVEFGPAEPSH